MPPRDIKQMPLTPFSIASQVNTTDQASNIESLAKLLVVGITALTTWYSSLDFTLQYFGYLVLADFITGTFAAIIQKRNNNTEFLHGLIRKTTIVGFVVLVYHGANQIGHSAIAITLIAVLSINQAVSVLRHMNEMKVWVPPQLMTFLNSMETIWLKKLTDGISGPLLDPTKAKEAQQQRRDDNTEAENRSLDNPRGFD